MSEYETYERRSVKVPLILLLITFTLFCIVVYLVYSSEPVPQKVTPSKEAIERLERTSEAFERVCTQTKMLLEFENARASNEAVIMTMENMDERIRHLIYENERLAERNVELEQALEYATNWMERMMVVLDGR